MLDEYLWGSPGTFRSIRARPKRAACPFEGYPDELPLSFEFIGRNDSQSAERVCHKNAIGLQTKYGNAMILEGIKFEDSNCQPSVSQLINVFKGSIRDEDSVRPVAFLKHFRQHIGLSAHQ